MKNLQNSQLVATFALIGAGILGGLAPIGLKIVLRELPPFTTLFSRITLTLIVLILLAHKQIPHILRHWKKVLLLATVLTVNVSFFNMGVKYTSAAASQILYALVPVLVLLENSFVGKEKLRIWHYIGIPIGFLGALVILIQPNIGESIGSFYGNALIFMGALSWSLYLIFSKKISEHLSPLALATGPYMIAWVAIGSLMVGFEGVAGIARLPSLSLAALVALAFVGIGLGVVMTFLYQWGIKHGSAVAAGSMVYISTLTAATFGYVLLHETLTARLFLGGALLLLGVFTTTTFPLIWKIRKG